jgi:hypothetical protein
METGLRYRSNFVFQTEPIEVKVSEKISGAVFKISNTIDKTTSSVAAIFGFSFALLVLTAAKFSQKLLNSRFKSLVKSIDMNIQEHEYMKLRALYKDVQEMDEELTVIYDKLVKFKHAPILKIFVHDTLVFCSLHSEFKNKLSDALFGKDELNLSYDEKKDLMNAIPSDVLLAWDDESEYETDFASWKLRTSNG